MTTPQQRALTAHRKGLRAANDGRPGAGARWIRSGLAELGWRERDAAVPEADRALVARLLMSLAHLESEQGRAEYGLGLLDHAERTVSAADRGHLLAQRGLVLLRIGRWRESLAQFTGAEPLLDTDREMLARVLVNRGVLHLNRGDVRLAERDLRRGADIAARVGNELYAAMATHNVGYCELLRGDISAALHLLNVAASVYRRLAPGNMPILETDRARALLAAGLATDAAAELDGAITAFRRQRNDQYCAEAELSRAQAALATGDLRVAQRWAAAAVRRFRARGNDAWTALAELTRLRARPRSARVAAEAAQLAERLDAHGLRADAALANLLAARALIAVRRRDEAAHRLAAAGTGRTLPLDVALVRRLTRAELEILGGRHSAGLAELRAGLAMLHTHRGRLGSLDLQTGASALGAELADAGLRLVLDRGSARQVFAWLE
ncbi:MAG: hypothetical protein ABSA93_19255, partial [Streptosporangiaceae bacterium]